MKRSKASVSFGQMEGVRLSLFNIFRHGLENGIKLDKDKYIGFAVFNTY